ncbi:MAG: hypothetical protein U0V73_15750 [Acidimicrobiia bacterium]
MKITRCTATIVTAGLLVTGVGAGAAAAASDPSKPANPSQPGPGAGAVGRAKPKFDCSKLDQLKALEGRAKKNIQDRISILTDAKALAGSGPRADRIQRRIDRLNGQISKLDARLAKATQHCRSGDSSGGSSTSSGATSS